MPKIEIFVNLNRLKQIFIISTLLYSIAGFSNEIEKDSTTTTTVKNKINKKKVKKTFFDKIDNLYPETLTKNYSYGFDDLTPEFTNEKLALEYPTSIVANDLQENVRSFFGDIDKNEGWVEGAINDNNLTQLPVGLAHVMNGVEYSIGVAKAKFTPEYTEMLVFARVKLPQHKDGRPRELFFGADKVKLSHDGGIIGDAKLVLLGNVNIPFNGGNWLLSLNGGFDYTNGNTTDKTYVTIGCDGVKGMGVEGSVQFSRSLLLPVDQKGKLQPATREEVFQIQDSVSGAYINKKIQVPNRVRGSFKVTAPDWNDILVNINLDPFVLKKQPDKFVFKLNQAVLDFSDIRNDPKVKFPDYYVDNGLLLPSRNSWRGVYVQTFEVMLPKEFKTINSVETNTRIAFGAHDLIIDSNGVSGNFYADNVFPLDEGLTSDRSAWAMSLDHIGVNLAANTIVGAEFEGEIILPVAKNSKFKYLGLIFEEEYLLAVKTVDTINFDVFSAKVRLHENSGIELKVREGRFLPKAILNGRMAITASQKKSIDTLDNKKGKSLVKFKGIEFQELVLQTESPIFEAKFLGYEDEVKLANFPISIGDIAFRTTSTNTFLEFDLKMNLMGKGDKGFAAATRLAIKGKFSEVNRKQKWEYAGLDLERIHLKANTGAFKLEGFLELMEDHPEYGDGFVAELKAEIEAFKGIELEAKAIFGKKDFRYWYFDAMIDNLPTKSAPTVVTLKGIAGGAFYRMQRKSFSSSFSPSGLSYVPNKEKGLGLKAMVMFGVVNDKAINGGAGFEMLFNNSGGISRMGLYGNLHLMKDLADLPGGGLVSNTINKVKEQEDKLNDYLDNFTPSERTVRMTEPFVDIAKSEYPEKVEGQAGVNAYLGIEYDFDNKILHGELDVFVDVAGGIVQGRASEGRAGWAVLHIEPKTWYLHVGTPDDRLGLKFGIGPLFVESGGYFMMGHKIPGSPPPPPEVAEILGVDAEELNYMRDENALGEGRGFAFGQDFKIDTGDMRALFFYARFVAGGGYDIMLKDYGEAKCKGSNDQIGINGWYANGQAYAYLQGEFGIRIKLFFVKKKIPIIKAGAAVLLQAKAPNPIWMRGYLGGHYNLLGGLIKGRFRFKITIGEECEFLDNAPLGGIKIITDLSPKNDATDVDVFAAPQATFSLKVNEPIVISEDEGDKTYKIILEQFKVLEDGKEITGEIEWSNGNDRATFLSTDILPPNTQLKVVVEVSFQEKVNGVFRVLNVDGQKAIEKEERTLTTGTAPTYIPLSNIEYAYPVVDQKHFYENEYDKGYIQLARGQDYLFDDQVWKSEIDVVALDGSKKTVDFSYSDAENKLNYTLPDLAQKQEYTFFINSKPKERTSNQSSDQYANTNTGDTENTAQVRSNTADEVSQDGIIERLTYNFNTSSYKTFKQKIKALRATDYQWGKVYSDVLYLSIKTAQDEGFELLELVGNQYTDDKPLLEVKATLEDDYFKKDMNPPMYSKYPLNNEYYFTKRDENEYGVPPSRALRIMSSYLTSLEYNVDRPWRETTFPYYYDLPYFYKSDMVDLKTQVSNDFADGIITGDHPAKAILDANFYIMRGGKYKVNMQYVLPGNVKGTQQTFDYKNPNNFR